MGNPGFWCSCGNPPPLHTHTRFCAVVALTVLPGEPYRWVCRCHGWVFGWVASAWMSGSRVSQQNVALKRADPCSSFHHSVVLKRLVGVCSPWPTWVTKCQSVLRLVCVCVCVSRSHSDAGSVSFPSDAETPPDRGSSFLRRVLWVALPLQFFLLLLVVFAFLLPMSEEDYCSHSNNFAHSFYPMLSYTNGPPPV